MPPDYYLLPNVMTADPNDYMANTTNGRTYTLKGVYDQMTHEGSTLTKVEALAAFEELTRGMIRLLSDGNAIVTPLVNIFASIVGVFNGEDDHFEASRYQVKLRVQPGVRLREAESRIATQKLQPKERLPVLLHYEDNATESMDSGATSGGAPALRAACLSMTRKTQSRAIFFLDTTTATKRG